MTKCMRCPKLMESDPLRVSWNHIYVNGRIQGHICPSCQTPEEAEEAIRNLPRDQAATWFKALDARLVDNSDFFDYLDSLPVDGSVIAPALGFAALADSSIGFQVGFIPKEAEKLDNTTDLILSCWFPCLSEPEEETGSKDGGVPTFTLDKLRLGTRPVFLECPPSDWMGWSQVLVVGEQTEKVHNTLSDLFQHYLDSLDT